MEQSDIIGHRSRRRAKPIRVIAAAGAIAVSATLMGVLGPLGASDASATSDRSAQNREAAVKRWFLERDPLEVKLENTLLETRQRLQEFAPVQEATGGPHLTGPALAPAVAEPCGRLVDVATALVKFRPNPDPRLRELVRAGLDEFVNAGRTCLRGDFPAALKLIADGLAERTAAVPEIDVILDPE